MQPRVVALLPLFDDCPEIVVSLEVLLHLRDGRVIADVLVVDEALAVVDLLGVFVCFVDPLLDVLGVLCDLLVVFAIAVVLEGAREGLKLIDGVVELFLVVLHLFDELLLFLVKESLLFLDPLHSFEWRAEHAPHLVVVLLVWELVMEVIES